MTLYELTDMYAQLMERYEAAETDDQREDVLAELDGLDETFEHKADAYARIMRNMMAEETAYAEEAKRMTAKARAAGNAAEAMRQRIMHAMQFIGVSEVKTSIGKWRIQKNPYSAQIIDADAVPAEYRIRQPDKIDRAGILRHYKETGEILPGVEMVRSDGVRFG